MSNVQDYIKTVLEPQIKWYEKRANSNKARYHICQITIIITSALIPVINAVDFAPAEIRITSSILGVVVIGITGLTQLKKFQENWILFRTNEEILKKEKNLYQYKAGEYSGSDSQYNDRLFIERTESIISSETSKFFTMHSQKPKLSTDHSS